MRAEGCTVVRRWPVRTTSGQHNGGALSTCRCHGRAGPLLIPPGCRSLPRPRLSCLLSLCLSWCVCVCVFAWVWLFSLITCSPSANPPMQRPSTTDMWTQSTFRRRCGPAVSSDLHLKPKTADRLLQSISLHHLKLSNQFPPCNRCCIIVVNSCNSANAPESSNDLNRLLFWSFY